MKALYQRLANFYDKIYYWKDYKSEVDFLERMLKKHKIKVREILDVACGTGNHALLLSKRGYCITGLDLNKEMLNIAKKKVNGARFVHGDMKNFNLNKKFDAVICLFSSMNYNLNLKELEKTLRNFHKHLKPKGIAVFDTEFGFPKEAFIDKYKNVDGYNDKNLTIARFGYSRRFGNKAKIFFTYLIRNKERFSFYQDVHNLGLFSPKEVIETMKKIGFKSKSYKYIFRKISGIKNEKGRVGYFFVGISTL